MATTTNFGWETPDDTDLVKDGALAIRTLGSAIDTSLVDLKGGTTGQVLSKTSNTDMDFTWVTSDDANAIQNAIVDAKGDLITATAADTPARLAVGSNDQVLTVDSSTATGLKWATPAGSSGPTFRAYRIDTGGGVGAQTFNQNTATKIAFNGETWDTDNCYDSTTNYRFTPNKAGYYQFNTNVSISTSGTVGRNWLRFYKNGSEVVRVWDGPTAQAYEVMGGSCLLYMNGSSDYVEVYISSAAATSREVDAGSSSASFDAVWIRS